MDKQFNEAVTVQDGSSHFDDLDTVVGEKKGTVSDMEDMRRLGKEQLFKVCSFAHETMSRTKLMARTAELQLHYHFRIRHDSDEHLASTAWARSSIHELHSRLYD